MAAEKVERAFREETPSLATLLQEVGSTLAPMVRSIQTGLSETAPAPATASGSRKEFDAEMATAAVARLDGLRDAPGNFDFDGALSALAERSPANPD